MAGVAGHVVSMDNDDQSTVSVAEKKSTNSFNQGTERNQRVS